jgi:hypothetical protein
MEGSDAHPRSAHFCHAHPQATVSHFCPRELLPLCLACLAQHRGHNCVSVAAAAVVLREHLGELSQLGAWPDGAVLAPNFDGLPRVQAPVGPPAVEISAVISALHSSHDEVVAAAEEAESAVVSACDAICSAAIARRDELLSAIRTQRERKVAALTAETQAAEAHLELAAQVLLAAAAASTFRIPVASCQKHTLPPSLHHPTSHPHTGPLRGLQRGSGATRRCDRLSARCAGGPVCEPVGSPAVSEAVACDGLYARGSHRPAGA